MTKVSIIGLGWIGLPLAHLLQKAGHSVIGSTTSEEKKREIQDQGVQAIQFALVPFPQGKAFQQLFTSEVLVINIPPKSRTTDGKFYLEQMKYLRTMIDQAGIQKVLFVSSSGVYPSESREDPYKEGEELTAKTTGNLTLLKGEQTFKNATELTIVRFGGLIGDDRIPGKYVAGKENVAGHTRVNFIYRSDAARMLAWIIEKELWNETYNGVAPVHTVRKDIYDQNVRELGFEPPSSYQNASGSIDRLVSGEKILQTGFEFDFPNPLHFPYFKTN
ncbi:NAD-dependent epimerase/dehydratase family protein [Algoriphagus winogradskyi]|uniref:Nucleoside-diphosphate-sugar epimerase n=1 Tax=Algoriphagus winogradskyi TaxID=237017 RepID=A0ABY1NNV2_9BACT|nr:NAD-dependent epimerase/dehydratase family protein [Algoriphagus winogradskyi]SMP13458.1 Nucleoside-diphosphate-sugar epimerase [Algoriphagus winogradskyi]